MKTIQIIVNVKGETTVLTQGFAGSSCRDATRLLEQALGTVQSDTATTEMYQNQNAEHQLKQRGGG